VGDKQPVGNSGWTDFLKKDINLGFAAVSGATLLGVLGIVILLKR
jgi:hypothetical protein